LSFVGGGWDFRPQGSRRIEGGSAHGERAEDLALTKSVEGFSRDSFKSGAEDDESDVTVLCASTGFGRKWHREGCTQEFVARVALKEQLFVSRQARGVSQEHAHRHVLAARIGFAAGVDEEFRDGAQQRRVEFEKASFVKECSHRRGGDGFGDGGEVEQGRWRNFGRRRLVCEVAESIEGDEAVLVGDGDAGGRKDVFVDCIAEDGEGGRKLLPLLVEG
jgi:hypothetical protein